MYCSKIKDKILFDFLCFDINMKRFFYLIHVDWSKLEIVHTFCTVLPNLTGRYRTVSTFVPFPLSLPGLYEPKCRAIFIQLWFGWKQDYCSSFKSCFQSFTFFWIFLNYICSLRRKLSELHMFTEEENRMRTELVAKMS